MRTKRTLKDIVSIIPAKFNYKVIINCNESTIITPFGVTVKRSYFSSKLIIYSFDLFNYLITELAIKPNGNKLYIKGLRLTIELQGSE